MLKRYLSLFVGMITMSTMLCGCSNFDFLWPQGKPGDTFVVTYHFDEGVMDSSTSITVSWGDTLDLPTPTKPYYDFLNWYTRQGGSKRVWQSNYSVYSNLDLYAEYEIQNASYKGQTFYITLNTLEPRYDGDVIEVKYGDTYTLPTLDRDNYLFECWLCNGKVVEIDSPFMFTSDVTFVAKWKFEISYDEVFNEPFGSYTTIITYYSDEYSQEERESALVNIPGTMSYIKSVGRDYQFIDSEYVRACLSGTVTGVGEDYYFGKYIEITTADSIIVRYASLFGYYVSLGEDILKGEFIGHVGECLYNQAAASTNYRLHIDVRVYDEYVDPFVCYYRSVYSILNH